ncbi:MAG: hypothetical protein ING73_12690 [Rhodocyclaceae bacterium]|nr:hypothetical protein [Rhodocyclaceae bacterium]MCA3035874.1 hypothetical protein [Rhodocyclaceae bacterium]MCA3047368.1 hypothetical protein [Rhodocyclaceae bacterium]MCA3051421.1 hypothetical protein [Rhodocyclaceae bacterium]MCA3060829.1 hypothetical protein [Rhodocyclaceae bacterium]
MKSSTYVMLLFVYILGVAMPSFAGVANPRGPEERPVTERTFRIVGNTHDALVTLSYPTPDRTIDRFVNGVYGRSSRFVGAFFAEFGYQGFFWQGRFGTVDLALDRISRPQGTPLWKDVGAVVAWLKKDAEAHNLSQTQMFLGQLENRTVWTEPQITTLNGVPCIRQEIRRGNNRANDSWVYYFLVDEDNLVEVDVRMTDNSDRPGLAKSNWYPRAVAFREKLLSAIKVNVVPTLAAQ